METPLKGNDMIVDSGEAVEGDLKSAFTMLQLQSNTAGSVEEADSDSVQGGSRRGSQDEADLAPTLSAISMKRAMDAVSTVEGSPLVVSLKKRVDILPTPVKFVPLMDTHAECEIAESKPGTETAAIVHRILTISTECDSHDTRKDHQESAERTKILCGPLGCLRRSQLAPLLHWKDANTIKPIPIADLLRVHDYSYIKHLQDRCDAAEDIDGAEGGSAAPSFYAPAGYLDSDTPIGKLSLSTAKLFCGAAVHAVDVLMKGYGISESSSTSTSTCSGDDSSISKAFVIGRPPGHHAGPNGCVVSNHHWKRPDMSSSGFCLLNTAAVAAAYARYRYGHNSQRAPRIAIVDVDVHHGNGTEEIVKNLRPHQQFLPLPSSWAPVSQLSYKPWLNENDAEDVLFSSIHLFAEEQFYPCSGCEADNTKNIINIGLTPIGPGPWDGKGRLKLTAAQRSELISTANAELRIKVTKMLLPRLRAFDADLLIISSGFDAHHEDLYHFLDDAAFHWLTSALCKCVSSGRVLSILEGGYSLQSVSTPARASKSKAAAKVATTSSATSSSAPSAGADISSASGVGTESNNNDASGLPAARANRGKTKKYDQFVSSCSNPNPVSSSTSSHDLDSAFAQQMGDGGLVRGVLSHIAAMAGIDRLV